MHFLTFSESQWLSMLPSAGETPLCSVNGDGECSIGAPQSGEYCSGYDNSTDCPRFRDFEALYMRGEQQLAQRKAEATAATNSLVFNAFIWLQVCPSSCLMCCRPSCPLCCLWCCPFTLFVCPSDASCLPLECASACQSFRGYFALCLHFVCTSSASCLPLPVPFAHWLHSTSLCCWCASWNGEQRLRDTFSKGFT